MIGPDDIRQELATKGGLGKLHNGKGWLDRLCPPIDIPTIQHNGYRWGVHVHVQTPRGGKGGRGDKVGG